MIKMNKDQAVNLIVRQRWRIAQTYLTILPIVGIMNTFLYFLIYLGVNDVSITVVQLLGIFSILLAFFALIGYFLDKLGYFKKDIKKSFSSAQLTAYKVQADWNALKIAYYSQFNKDELEVMMEEHELNRL